MGKDSEKSLVGQPIYNQILKIIPREVFNRIVLEQKSDYRIIPFTIKDDKVMPVAFVIAEKQVFAMLRIMFFPVLPGNLNSRRCRMFYVFKRNIQIIKQFVKFFRTVHVISFN